jgi:hypothetical protein
MLRRRNDPGGQIRILRPDHPFNPDFVMFDCGCLAFGKASLTLRHRGANPLDIDPSKLSVDQWDG